MVAEAFVSAVEEDTVRASPVSALDRSVAR